MFTPTETPIARFNRAVVELVQSAREIVGARAVGGAGVVGAGSSAGAGAGAVGVGVGVGAVGASARAGGVSDAELIERMGLSGDALRALESVLVTDTGEIAARSASAVVEERLTTKMGCARVTELVENLTKVSGRRVNEWMKVSSAIRPQVSLLGEVLPAKLPALGAGVRDGIIGMDSAIGVARALLPPRRVLDPGQVAVADEAIARAARGLDDEASDDEDESVIPDRVVIPCADILAVHTQAWAAVIDPDGSEPEERAALRNRGLNIGVVREGLVSLRGRLLPEVAEQLRRIFDSIGTPRHTSGVQFRPTGEDDYDSAGTGEVGHLSTAGNGDSVIAGAGDTGNAGHQNADEPCIICGADEGCHCAVASAVDSRTADQKRHDAFATALFVSASTAKLPVMGAAAPTLLVMVDEADLRASMDPSSSSDSASRSHSDPGSGPESAAGQDSVSGSTDGPGAGSGRGARTIAGPAHLPGIGASVPVAAAHHIMCCGFTQYVTMRADGKITHISSPARIFTAFQRRAIALRDGNCIIPGCGVPAAWSEIHHVQEHSQGGETHTDNGVLLCWFHHRYLEHSGWSVRMTDGIPEVQAPAWIDPTGKWRRSTTSALRLRRNHPRRT